MARREDVRGVPFGVLSSDLIIELDRALRFALEISY
jgi:hypothetical protein